jgi:hypothetical protein
MEFHGLKFAACHHLGLQRELSSGRLAAAPPGQCPGVMASWGSWGTGEGPYGHTRRGWYNVQVSKHNSTTPPSSWRPWRFAA